MWSGSAIGGVAVGLATTGVISPDLRLILVGGFAGGLTTFSTWSVETIQLFMERQAADGTGQRHPEPRDRARRRDRRLPGRDCC